MSKAPPCYSAKCLLRRSIRYGGVGLRRTGRRSRLGGQTPPSREADSGSSHLSVLLEQQPARIRTESFTYHVRPGAAGANVVREVRLIVMNQFPDPPGAARGYSWVPEIPGEVKRTTGLAVESALRAVAQFPERLLSKVLHRAGGEMP